MANKSFLIYHNWKIDVNLYFLLSHCSYLFIRLGGQEVLENLLEEICIWVHFWWSCRVFYFTKKVSTADVLPKVLPSLGTPLKTFRDDG